MSRAPFQVLVLPYIVTGNDIKYAIFKRSDGDYWQSIAGGGEDSESPLEAAKREAFEEAGIGPEREFVQLDSFSTIPVVGISGFLWGPDVLVVPQYCFGVKLDKEQLQISHEHTAYEWMDFENASRALHWDSNKSALWELDYRLRRNCC